MKKGVIKYTLSGILFFIAISASSQTSWSYAVYFNIYSQSNEKFIEEDFLSGKIKVYSHKFGIHSNRGPLFYNERLEMFGFAQGTIATGSSVVFEVEDEIMHIRIPTHHLRLDSIVFEPGVFDLRYWKNEDIYQREDYPNWISVYALKYDISYFKCNEETPYSIKDLEELKLEIKEND